MKRKVPALTPPVTTAEAQQFQHEQQEGHRHALPAGSKRQRISHATQLGQETGLDECDNRLSKYVNQISFLLHKRGWNQVVQSRRQRGDFGELRIHHPARRFLQYLKKRGVPVILATPFVEPRPHPSSADTWPTQVS